MVGRTEAEAREVAAELTGRPAAELTLERGKCLRSGEQGRCPGADWKRKGYECWESGVRPDLSSGG